MMFQTQVVSANLFGIALNHSFGFAVPQCFGMDLTFIAQEYNGETWKNSPFNESLIHFRIQKNRGENHPVWKKLENTR